jgi:hypothetical protein
MAIDTFSCPECQVKLRRSPHLQPGAQVQCPRCRFQFPVPPPEQDASPVPPPVSTPRASSTEGYGETPSAGPRRDEERVAAGAYDRDDYGRDHRRFAGEDDDYPRTAQGTPGELSGNYQVDLGRWFSIATQHWSSVLGPFIGYTFLLLFIALLCAIPFVGLLLAIFLMPPLAAGFTIVALAQLKGKPWTFGDFFGGFHWYGSLVGMTLLSGLIYMVCALPAIIAYIAFIIVPLQARRGGPGPEALLVVPALLVTFAAFIVFQVKFLYAPMLIIDRNFGAIDSLAGSWKLTRGNFWMTFLVVLLLQVINSAGAMACYVGMLFTFPLTILVPVAGYLLIAGSRPPVSLDGRPQEPSPRPYPDRRDDY